MGAGKGYFTDYPKRVGFILSNEFCERFSFYGMKAILVIFLTRALDFPDDDATSIYHGFNMACYFTPIFGAILADGYWGHYKTIFIISIVYGCGNVVMASGAVPWDNGEYIKAIPFVGLILIAIGTGGIKPCVAAFGANQFEEHQVRQKQTFFSMFYMAINVGSLVSMILTPLIRSNVECFGGECYALAFGVPAALMIVAIFMFLIGTHWYTRTPPGENIIGKLFGCIAMGLRGKCCGSKGEGKREHWLDAADSRYDKKFVSDVKAVMRVLFMFIPLPMFYALFDQQGSRWILQAGKMNGDFGGFVLEPDLIQVINPILVVAMVPLFESLLFPCLQKLKLPNSPLQRLGCGMFLAGTAFVISGFLQLAIDNASPSTVPGGMARFKVINASPCEVSGEVRGADGELYDIIPDKIQDLKVGNYSIYVEFKNCDGVLSVSPPINETFQMDDSTSYNMIAYWDKLQKGQVAQTIQRFQRRTGKGKSRLSVFNTWDTFQQIVVDKVNNDEPLNATRLETSDSIDLPHKKLTVISGNVTGEVESKSGAVYTAVLQYSKTDADDMSKVIKVYEDISSNNVNILYMIPQYLVMTMGEVFFSITGLSFAYSQSPATMKAVLQAAWLLNNSLGNCIVMIITAIGSLPNQTAEFFMFAGLMYVTVIIFAFMSLTYVYVDQSAAGDQNRAEEKKGIENLGMENNELPPTYDVVMTEGEKRDYSTYM